MRVKRSGAYQIINEINGKSYVGSSKDIVNRWKQWRRSFKCDLKYKSLLRLAVRKYGVEHFTFLILGECEPTKACLEVLEQHYIDTLKPAYNLRKKAYMNSEEALQKMKDTIQGGRSGGKKARENGTHIFLHLSAEQRKNISAKGNAAVIAKYGVAVMKRMTELALSDEAKAKRKATLKEIKHQQGARNSHFGTCWITNSIGNKMIKKEELESYQQMGFRKGRVGNFSPRQVSEV